MRKRKGKGRTAQEPDLNRLAQHLVRMSTNTESRPAPIPINVTPEVSRVMAEMGRRGGKIGGKRRAERMTEEERSTAAAAAARARWAKRPAS